MSLQVAKHFFISEEFERMGEAGIFHEGARLELIEGGIVETSPIGSRHAACVNFLNRFLNRIAGDKAIISTQNPIRLNDLTEPQPDIALLRLREDFYRESHPKPADVLLVIEVADTTFDYDRSIKLPLYAKAGIPEAWIVNLPAERVEIYVASSGDSFLSAQWAGRGEQAEARTFAGLSIPADMILG